MKSGVTTVCLMVLFALQTNFLYAKEAQEYIAEADQYYAEKNYKKAYKTYYKLAKKGDHYSQSQVSKMFANGEGKEVDLTEAYAWSVLAAEGGDEDLVQNSEMLLQEAPDKALAEKKAAKLKKKYGKDTLRKQAEKRERIRRNNELGGCTGSKLGCGRG